MAKIALYLPNLGGGGMERVMLNLAQGFLHRAHEVDIVVSQSEGAYSRHVPPGARIVQLEPGSALQGQWLALRASPYSHWKALARPVLFAPKPGKQVRYLASLVRYLRSRRPNGVIAAYPYCNLVCAWAKRLAEVSSTVVVTEHNTTSLKVASKARKGPQWEHLPPLLAAAYPMADAVVAVSNGVADDLAQTTGLPRTSVQTIYNPVVTATLSDEASSAPPHHWLSDEAGPPVVVAAGRLVRAKNFELLLRAFARLRSARASRLLLFGEGPERPRLEALLAELGIANSVSLPGFVTNPYAAFSRAAVFVLSSDWEGLPTVLIEALACGCPVISTDCPSGPAEILENGRYGRLVPTGDVARLAEAMAQTLDSPLPSELLKRRGGEFSQSKSIERYLQLLLPDGRPGAKADRALSAML